jgi:hypothetical protein
MYVISSDPSIYECVPLYDKNYGTKKRNTKSRIIVLQPYQSLSLSAPKMIPVLGESGWKMDEPIGECFRLHFYLGGIFSPFVALFLNMDSYQEEESVFKQYAPPCFFVTAECLSRKQGY